MPSGFDMETAREALERAKGLRNRLVGQSMMQRDEKDRERLKDESCLVELFVIRTLERFINNEAQDKEDEQ